MSAPVLFEEEVCRTHAIVTYGLRNLTIVLALHNIEKVLLAQAADDSSYHLGYLHFTSRSVLPLVYL